MMGMASKDANIITDSGYLELENDNDGFWVNHNLGRIPNFAAIWVDTINYDLIPNGSCVMCTYQLAYYYRNSVLFNRPMCYGYWYKHQTSGNFISGLYTLGENQYSDSSFFFSRGTVPWKKLDINGNPLKYKWLVGYMKD